MAKAQQAKRQGIIAYYRVSTDKQGESGLGLDAQQAAVSDYAQRSGLYTAAAYTEVESGGNDERTQLAKAIAHARRSKSKLVVAKLDRLTRDTQFLLGLASSDADLVFCDLPQMPEGPMGRFFLTIMAAVAELERGLISQRTKAAMERFKALKVVPKRLRDLYGENVPQDLVDATAGKLGASLPQCRNLTPEARKKGNAKSTQAKREQAMRAYEDIAALMSEWRFKQGMTLQDIADKLNEEGYTTRNDRPWSATQVMRVLSMALKS